MSSLVLELQADCLDSNVAVSALLRKALVVSTKLQLADFRTWCQSETNGYTDLTNTPDYRKIHGEIKVRNPYHGWQPVLFEDSDTPRLLGDRKLGQPISQLEDLLKSKTSESLFNLPLPPEILYRVFDRHYLELGLIPVVVVSPSDIARILDMVRNTILEWTLKLEQDGILGEEMRFTEQEQEKAMSNPNIRIDNFQGILGNVTQSAVSQDLSMTVTAGDLDSLCSLLSGKGVQRSDVDALREALSEDPRPTVAGTFGSKVADWIAQMVGKAASGAWKISVGAAGSLLATAIAKYYGF
jgi:hypothetical protein